MTNTREPKGLVHEGLKAMQLEDIQHAEDLFQQALSIDPDYADANHLLGILHLQFHNSPDIAEHFISQAQSSQPHEPVFLNSLGTVCWHQGKLQSAIQAFENAVKLKPDYIDAYYNLGNTQRDLKNFHKAQISYQKVIELDPEHVNAYNDLGISLQYIGGTHDAIEQYNLALEQDPMRADIYLNLANAYLDMGDREGALFSIKNALSIDPDNSGAYNNLGAVYYEQEDYAKSISAYRQALQLNPCAVQTLFNLSLVLHKNREYEKALDVQNQALEIKRDWPPLLVNHANTLFKLNRLQEAITNYHAALKINPKFTPAFINLAGTYRRLGDMKQSIKWFEKVILVEPDNVIAQFGKSLALLKSGAFSAGWRNYEWRFEGSGNHSIRLPNLLCVEWHGEDISESTLTVIAEQGLGDIIHFTRYIPELRKRCRSITFICPPALRRLFKDLPGVDLFYDRDKTLALQTDYHVHLLSLPKIFNTTLDSIPSQVPYVSAEPVDIKFWKDRLDPEKMNIGLVWGGNPDQLENFDRSCPLEALLPLTEIPGTTFYSLQKGVAKDQLLELPEAHHKIIDFTDELDDFADTAALVKVLDLVITIDTSVAHLVGALNQPVWTLLWFAHCWRYLQNRDDSPWYPSMRLFRQPNIGDWSSVVDQVSKELFVMIKEKTGTMA